MNDDLIHVLYVDDEPDFLEMGKRILETHENFIVESSTSANEALKKLKGSVYEVIVSDYDMPDLDGISFLKQLKEEGNKIPFILLTGRGNEDIVIEALNAGAAYYIRKDKNVEGIFFELGHWIKDIINQKKILDELAYRKDQFYKIFNHINDAIHVHEVRDDYLPGTLIEVNDIACTMLGYTREEMLRLSPLEFSTEYHSIPLEEIGNRLKIMKSAIFETGHKKKDGTIIPVEINVHIYSFQEKEIALAVVRDISLRKHNEEVIRQMVLDQEIILDNIPAMVWYKDTNNNFIRVNRNGAQYLGKSIEEIEGKSTYELFHDLADKYYQDDLEVIKSRTPKTGIVEQMTLSNGEIRWVQTDKIPLLNGKGEVEKLIVFVIDIDENKKYEIALKTVNKKLNLLSSITRHDILNQIQVLFYYSDIISKQNNDNSLTNYIEKIRLSTNNIYRQLIFSRDYQDIGVKAPTWQNIHDLINKIIKSFKFEKLILNNEVEGILVYADPLLEKVFYNLTENTIKYGEKATKLSYYAQQTGESLVIIVEDDGVGVPDNLKNAIFNREYFKNTGFGLNLSREILTITDINIKETGTFYSGARFEIIVPKGGYRFSENKSDPT